MTGYLDHLVNFTKVAPKSKSVEIFTLGNLIFRFFRCCLVCGLQSSLTFNPWDPNQKI